ncbi:hypothetical protein BT96DRAFT_943322 [Gymnopus androsaceus JB14]|uniref:Uncharacterized protein n=1 Tax=Gymnopus androsaceus JB14 TaxID=1447944 RepID=A0A6A4H938_9AGAR|nr:hypothetical protein BT96DRAFT_943322 [Gymnopus androsaceus JB14]
MTGFVMIRGIVKQQRLLKKRNLTAGEERIDQEYSKADHICGINWGNVPGGFAYVTVGIFFPIRQVQEGREGSIELKTKIQASPNRYQKRKEWLERQQQQTDEDTDMADSAFTTSDSDNKDGSNLNFPAELSNKVSKWSPITVYCCHMERLKECISEDAIAPAINLASSGQLLGIIFDHAKFFQRLTNQNFMIHATNTILIGIDEEGINLEAAKDLEAKLKLRGERQKAMFNNILPTTEESG